MEDDRASEDSWFQRNEKQLLEAARLAREKREAERRKAANDEEVKRLRDLHFMKCPKDGHDMMEEEADGARVDRCTFCEGLFLDAGELERIFAKRAEERRGIFRKLIRL